jgi:outer membrane lipoprotein-sorting protein
MWASAAKRVATALAIGMAAVVATTAPATADDTSMVVEKLTQAQLSISYQGEKHVYNFHLPTPRVTTYSIIRTPRGERREYRTSRTRVVVIDDGRHQWVYLPNQRLVKRRPSPSGTHRRRLAERNAALLQKNYRIEILQRDATMGGRPIIVAKFAPLVGSDRPVRLLWIDREKGLPLRTEVYDAQGLRVMTFFSSISYASSPDSDALALKVPRATRLEAEPDEVVLSPEVLSRAVDFPVLQPKNLPPGFALVGARLKGKGPQAELRLLYSDGLSTISLFQRRRPLPHRTRGPKAIPVELGEADGNLYRFGLLCMVEWERSPVTYTMVGEVSENELLASARSIRKGP